MSKLARELQLRATLSSFNYHKVYTSKGTMQYKRVVERYTAVASDQSMNTKEYQGDNDDTINFSSEVHLLAGKLVFVVAIHSLGGSRANRHHTPNLQPGATQSRQDEDPQATRNLLELPLVLCQERHKNPS